MLARFRVHTRIGSRTRRVSSGFKIAFENLATIVVVAGELAQTNRVWFFAPTRTNPSLSAQGNRDRMKRDGKSSERSTQSAKNGSDDTVRRPIHTECGLDHIIKTGLCGSDRNLF